MCIYIQYFENLYILYYFFDVAIFMKIILNGKNLFQYYFKLYNISIPLD